MNGGALAGGETHNRPWFVLGQGGPSGPLRSLRCSGLPGDSACPVAGLSSGNERRGPGAAALPTMVIVPPGRFTAGDGGACGALVLTTFLFPSGGTLVPLLV